VTAEYFLTTPRLGFRSWSDADLELAMSLWGDPEVTALFDSRGRLSREQVQERLTRELDSERELGIQYWPFFLREAGEFVGCAGLKPYDAASTSWASICGRRSGVRDTPPKLPAL
jgi:ribosomal-protein-alanine N-acetyltransferase